MKKIRKMLSAIIMIVISITLLSTASFAWFSMNDKVEATSMNVTVTTPGDLKIIAGHVDNQAASKGGNSASGDNPNKNTLFPSSSFDGTKFYFAKRENVEESGGVTQSGYLKYDVAIFQQQFNLPPTVVGYIDYNFTIYNGTDVDLDIVPQMTLTNTKYTKAMRSAILVEENGAINKVTYLGAGTGASGQAVSDDSFTLKNFVTKTQNFKIATKTGKKIIIRVWIEGGEDVVTVGNFTQEGIGTFNFLANFSMAK